MTDANCSPLSFSQKLQQQTIMLDNSAKTITSVDEVKYLPQVAASPHNLSAATTMQSVVLNGQEYQYACNPGVQVVTVDSPQTSLISNQGEEPLYVNAKQYHRILKRREAREKLEKSGRVPKERQKYLHESRHRHALNRNRAPGGKFDKKLSQNTIQQEFQSPVTKEKENSTIEMSSMQKQLKLQQVLQYQ